jgi:hypothetical protein
VSDLVEWQSAAGTVTIPRRLEVVIIGSQSRNTKEKDRARFFVLSIFQQAWEDPSLLQNNSIRQIFETEKAELCEAIRKRNPFPFEHIAAALKQATVKPSDPAAVTTAIAFAFITLRLEYNDGPVPTEELQRETRRHWALAQTADEADFKEPNWSAEFKKLGIRSLVIRRKTGRPRRNS